MIPLDSFGHRTGQDFFYIYEKYLRISWGKRCLKNRIKNYLEVRR
jgi:hypothetical protein